MSELKAKIADLSRQVQFIRQQMADLGQLPTPEIVQVISELVEVISDLANRLNCLDEKT
jgi:hypothetical protein